MFAPNQKYRPLFLRIGVLLVMVLVMMLHTSMIQSMQLNGKTLDIIGHRGAPNLRPEHTYESYLLAQQNGAEYIEFDVMPTKDDVLVCTHSFELSGRFWIGC